MASSLQLEIITPEGKAFSESVDWVTLPASQGELGIYPQHVPLVTPIVSGHVIAHKGHEAVVLEVGRGFVEVTPERVAILTVLAARADDESQIAEARRRAEERFREKTGTEEEASANAAIARSLSQIKFKRRQR